MNYSQYLKIAHKFGYTGERLDMLARIALLPAAPHLRGNPDVMPHLRNMQCFKAYPGLLRVPGRTLKRWAMRALLSTVPKRGRLNGPRLAMARRGQHL